jgi:aspartate 1-decarboxylase
MKSKIHRATVTQSHLNYIGSLTISADLMEAAEILPNEKVQLVNLNNGARLSTYVIEGPRGAGVIGVNGPSARLAQLGDMVIILTYAAVTSEEARTHKPTVVHVDGKNRITGLGNDAAEALPGSDTVRGDQALNRS